jgi:translation initiation factor 5
MAQLNVDPTSKDQFYRYKMPAVRTKVEGNGNGIKTVIPNVREICTKLERPVEYLMKFFGTELGAQSMMQKREDKWLVMGAFPTDRIQEKVYDFITRFVLCKSCRNPETNINIDKKDIILVCRACSKTSVVSPAEKLHKYILQHHEDMLKQEKAARKKHNDPNAEETPDDGTGAGATGATKAVDVEQEEAEIDRKTRKATAADTLDTTDTRENPVVVLKKLIDGGASLELTTGRIFDIKTDYGMRETDIVRLLFRAVFAETAPTKFFATLLKNIELFKRFVDKKDAVAVLIRETELLVFKDAAAMTYKFPIILRVYFDHSIVDEQNILDWHANIKKSKDIKPDFAAKLRTQSQPLIDWLRASDDTKEEEEEEEEEE